MLKMRFWLGTFIIFYFLFCLTDNRFVEVVRRLFLGFIFKRNDEIFVSFVKVH